jgi:hypothetical protein
MTALAELRLSPSGFRSLLAAPLARSCQSADPETPHAAAAPPPSTPRTVSAPRASASPTASRTHFVGRTQRPQRSDFEFGRSVKGQRSTWSGFSAFAISRRRCGRNPVRTLPPRTANLRHRSTGLEERIRELRIRKKCLVGQRVEECLECGLVLIGHVSWRSTAGWTNGELLTPES